MATTAVKEVSAVEALREMVREVMESQHVPGLAIGIHDGEEEIFECFGVTSIENPLPVTEETLFQIGSTTKTMTALAVMRLVEEGKLTLDEPVKTYLSDFAMSDPEVTNGLTLRHILTHTGGFDGDYFVDFGRGDDALARCVASLKELSQVSPLGEVFSYCNAGFYITGRVIEVVTGKPYETAIRELVLDPLGLNASVFFPEEAMVHRFAMGHEVHGEEVKIAKPWPLPRIANPAGGITASITDNLRYARFLMGDGTAEVGSRILSDDNLKLMQSALVPAELNDYVGLSWFSKEIDGVRVIRHGGDTNGQTSAFMFAPERQFALAVLMNASQFVALQEITKWVLKNFLGVEDPKPMPIDAGDEQLDPLVGDYETLNAMLQVKRDGDRLSLNLQIKPDAMAAISSEPPPPLPVMQAALSGPGRIVLLDGPYKNLECDIIRRDGAIRWLRVGGRLYTRIE